MADRIKTVSTYNGTSWGSEVPIGADASNVDVTLSNNTKSNLQTVLGSTPSGSSITERINSKISTSGGDVADTVVSKNINNYDSSTTAGDDILTDTAATMSTNTSTLWSRFNLFRKKVSNNFANYFEKSNLVSSDVGVTSTGDNNTAYTTAAINNYLSNVIGYTSASDIDPDVGSVATQLSTLNNNFITSVTLQIATTKFGAVGSWDHYIRFGNIVVIDAVHIIPTALSVGTILAEGYPGCPNGAAPILMTDNNHTGAATTTYRAYLQSGGTLRLGVPLSAPSSSTPYSMRLCGAYITND